jgi:prevent-host-death family protein
MTTTPDPADALRSIVESVTGTTERAVITRHGQPVAVVMDFSEYEAFVETLDILSDDATMDALAEAESESAPVCDHCGTPVEVGPHGLWAHTTGYCSCYLGRRTTTTAAVNGSHLS